MGSITIITLIIRLVIGLEPFYSLLDSLKSWESVVNWEIDVEFQNYGLISKGLRLGTFENARKTDDNAANKDYPEWFPLVAYCKFYLPYLFGFKTDGCPNYRRRTWPEAKRLELNYWVNFVARWNNKKLYPILCSPHKKWMDKSRFGLRFDGVWKTSLHCYLFLTLMTNL